MMRTEIVSQWLNKNLHAEPILPKGKCEKRILVTYNRKPKLDIFFMDHFTIVTHDLFLQNVDIFSMNFVDIS